MKEWQRPGIPRANVGVVGGDSIDGFDQGGVIVGLERRCSSRGEG